MILCSSPHAQYLTHKAEIDAAILRVLEKGWYILGDEVRAFEAEFAAYLGVAHAIGVGSGTEALHLALRASGIGPGDEVVTVSHTAVATVAAVELAGATPVLADIDPQTYTIDPNQVEALIGPRTRAVIPVHLYGQPADLAPLLEVARRRGLRVIEDVAQAHGAFYQGRRAGSWSDLACFSFYPTKNLGALGDGGAVVTNHPALAEKVRLLREYGWAERYISHFPGFNSRLDEMQAAVLRVKLRHLDADNERRRRWASFYTQRLGGTELGLPICHPDRSHVYHLYVVRSHRRDALQSWLKGQGVSALIHYPRPVHLQQAYKGRLRGEDRLPETVRAAREVLSLPIYPELTADQAEQVVAAVQQFEE